MSAKQKKKLIQGLEILAKYYKVNKKGFRSNAYNKAIMILKSYDGPLDEMQKEKGIGKGIFKKWVQLRDTGSIEDVELANEGKLLTKKIKAGKIKPISEKDKIIQKFEVISWIGKSTAKKLYKQGYRSLADLEAKPSSILNKNQRIMLEYYRKLKPIPRSFITKFGHELNKIIVSKNYQLLLGGSYRRGKATSGDIDIVVESTEFKLKDLVHLLKEHDIIIEELSHGKSEYKCIAQNTNSRSRRLFRLDILFATKASWPAAILAYTGNAALNREMRLVAKEKGMKLSQHGLYKTKTSKKPMNLRTEKAIFEKLGYTYKPPKKRG